MITLIFTKKHFLLSEDISTRVRDEVDQTFSGLMMILFPSGKEPKEDMEMILAFAIEGRKQVKDQLLHIDTTYPPVSFGYTRAADSSECKIQTAEEKMYPQHDYQKFEDIKKKKSQLVKTIPPQVVQNTMTEEARLNLIG